MDTPALPQAIGQISATPDLIVLILMVGVGLVLWTAGAKIAKIMCAASGLLVGTGTAMLFIPEGTELTTVLLATAAGSIVGTILGLLLFRLWVAISCALVFAALAPIFVLLWESHVGPLPQVNPTTDVAATAPADIETSTAPTDDPAADLADDLGPDAPWWQPTRRWYAQQVSRIRQTWDGLDQQPRWMTGIGTFVAALIGLAIGLIGPNIAAAAQSSLLGAFMALLGIENILALSLSELPDWWPQTLSARITTFAVVAVVGVVIQLLMTRHADDS